MIVCLKLYVGKIMLLGNFSKYEHLCTEAIASASVVCSFFLTPVITEMLVKSHCLQIDIAWIVTLEFATARDRFWSAVHCCLLQIRMSDGGSILMRLEDARRSAHFLPSRLVSSNKKYSVIIGEKVQMRNSKKWCLFPTGMTHFFYTHSKERTTFFYQMAPTRDL